MSEEKLNLYECDELIKLVEARAEMNDGELSDDDMAALVKAQTGSITQLSKLVGYVKYLDGLATLAKEEEARLKSKRQTAENRVASIKRYLLPYIEAHGPVSVGVHRISTRKSKGVVLADGFDNELYCEKVVTIKPNKKAIKESIEAGIEVKGAVLENRVSVQVK